MKNLFWPLGLHRLTPGPISRLRCTFIPETRIDFTLPCTSSKDEHQNPDQNKIALRTATVIDSPSSMNQRTQDEQGHRSQAAAAPCRMAEFLSAAGWV
jgi:hypothetical protein